MSERPTPPGLAPGLVPGLVPGLAPEQGPPLAIPLSFYALVPIAMVAAGALLITQPAALLVARWSPSAMAVAHVGTLGVLGAAMLGSLYQMIPVVAGGSVPWRRLPHVVHGLWVIGTAALAWGFVSSQAVAYAVASATLGAALVGFLVPVSIALARAPARTPTVTGLRLAVGALAVVAALGVAMALGRAGWLHVATSTEWLQTHVGLGLIVWVGGLIWAVSWQVLPMFFLSPPAALWSQRLTLGCLALTLVGPPSALLFAPQPHRWIGPLLAPGALAVWLLQPLLAARALHQRRRRRKDVAVAFWWLGVAAGALCFAASAAALLLADPRWPVAFGWLAIWGWASLIVHGMLTRIVPFLLWFHRYAGLLGLLGQTADPSVPSISPVPPISPISRLQPKRAARVGLWAHASAVVLGVAALATATVPLAAVPLFWAAGVALVIAGATLAGWMVAAVRVTRADKAAGALAGRSSL